MFTLYNVRYCLTEIKNFKDLKTRVESYACFLP